MQPTNDTDYKQLFSQLIKKQMLILGPDITLAKVGNVTGLTVDMQGEVQKIEGDPQAMLQSLINQFVELSGMIVKKTMESILTSYPAMAGIAMGGMGMATATATANPTPTQPVTVSSVPVATIADKPVFTSEPPPIPPIDMDHVVAQEKTDEKKVAEPGTFSKDEMADLNKALEQLSKAPLSTEQSSQI